MAQYTVFYKDDAEKEIQQAYNGVCEDSDFIAHFTYSSDEFTAHYLDLLNYREISSQIAEQFVVTHQSPQLLVVKNGKVVANASHEGINDLQLSTFL